MAATELDKSLARLAVKFHKATKDQARDAIRELRAWHERGQKGDIIDVFVAQRVITPRAGRQLRIMATQDVAPQIPGYRIIEPLGGGGMGVVYKAEQTDLGREVALKVLRPDVLEDAEAVQRFMREARAAGRLDHPNIVRAWDVSTGDKTAGVPPYLAMEYIRGETLHQILQRQGKLSEKQTLMIGRAVADALDHAYRAGLVHRDVKPDNIMISQDGQIKLCDLGLAKSVAHDQSLTRPDMTHGTPHFMSPEQAQGLKDLDIRSDLYSLGCTLYRVAVGKPPYSADSAMEILLKHLELPPPSPKAMLPELSIEFDRIVLKLLQKDPSRRYQYPAHVATDIALVLDGEKPRLDYHVPFRPPRPETRDSDAVEPSAAASAASSDATPAHTVEGAGTFGTVDLAEADPDRVIAREASLIERREALRTRPRKPRSSSVQEPPSGRVITRRLSRSARFRLLLVTSAVVFLGLGVALAMILRPSGPDPNPNNSTAGDGNENVPVTNGHSNHADDNSAETLDAARRRARARAVMAEDAARRDARTAATADRLRTVGTALDALLAD